MSKELEILEELNNLNDENVVYVYKEYWNEIQKKLKVLEIIKEIIPIEKRDFFYYKETDTYFFIGCKVSKEQYDFLKEELL